MKTWKPLSPSLNAFSNTAKPFAIYYNDVSDLETAKNNFEDAYQGEYETFLAYATEIFDELYAHSIPENLRYYIDYEAFARDLEAEGYFIEDGHVFRPVLIILVRIPKVNTVGYSVNIIQKCMG